MKTLLIAGLMLLGFSSTAMAIPPCDLPWQGYIWGACLDLPGLAHEPRIVYRTRIVYVPVHHYHHRGYHRHHRHWWN